MPSCEMPYSARDPSIVAVFIDSMMPSAEQQHHDRGAAAEELVEDVLVEGERVLDA